MMDKNNCVEKLCAFCNSFISSIVGGDHVFQQFFKEFIIPISGIDGGIDCPSAAFKTDEIEEILESWTVCLSCWSSVEEVVSSKVKLDGVEARVLKLQKEILKELDSLLKEVDRMCQGMEVVESIIFGGNKMKIGNTAENGEGSGERMITKEEKFLIRRFKARVGNVFKDLHIFKTKTSSKLLKKKPPIRSGRNLRKSKSPPTQKQTPTPSVSASIPKNSVTTDDLELLNIAIKVEKTETVADNHNDYFEDDPMNDFDHDGIPSPPPADSGEDSNSVEMSSVLRKKPIVHETADSDTDYGDESGEDYQAQSSDDDFVPEDEDEDGERPAKKRPRSRGPYKKKTEPSPPMTWRLKEGISSFRRKLISRCWKANTPSTSTSLPLHKEDPRRKYAVQYDPQKDIFYLEDIEIACLDTRKRLKCTRCNLVVGTNWKRKEDAIDIMFDHIIGKHLNAYKCRFCVFTFDDYKRYKRHQMNDHNDCRGESQLVTCDICGRTTRRKGLRTHKWTHLSEEEKADPANRRMMPHRFRYPELYETRRFQCETCGKAFKRKGLLESHEDSHKNRDEREKVMCTDCGIVVLKISFRIHKRLHCNSDKKPKGVPCPVCDTLVKNTKVLIVHLRERHPHEKAYSCDICGMRFQTKPLLSRHIVVHSDERKHVCPVCGTGFKKKSNLNRHVKGCSERGPSRRGGGGRGQVGSASSGNMEFIGHFMEN